MHTESGKSLQQIWGEGSGRPTELEGPSATLAIFRKKLPIVYHPYHLKPKKIIIIRYKRISKSHCKLPGVNGSNLPTSTSHGTSKLWLDGEVRGGSPRLSHRASPIPSAFPSQAQLPPPYRHHPRIHYHSDEVSPPPPCKPSPSCTKSKFLLTLLLFISLVAVFKTWSAYVPPNRDNSKYNELTMEGSSCSVGLPKHGISGYFNLPRTTLRYFYYYAAAESKPMNKAPLILWMSGGPGCSSLLAAMMENGPCKVDRDEMGKARAHLAKVRARQAPNTYVDVAYKFHRRSSVGTTRLMWCGWTSLLGSASLTEWMTPSCPATTR